MSEVYYYKDERQGDEQGKVKVWPWFYSVLIDVAVVSQSAEYVETISPHLQNQTEKLL